MTDQWHCKDQDHEVCEQVGHSIPTKELVLIDTSSSCDRFVPEECNRLAFKNCDKDVYEEIECHDEPCQELVTT